MKKKPVVVMDLASTGKGGGPFTSTIRVMNSSLKDRYEFKTITYKTEIGRYISIKRIIDLKTQLSNLKPDIVHFTGLQLSGFHVAVACKIAGIKNTVVTVHGFSGEAIQLNLIKRIFLTFLIEPLTLLMVKKVYGVSEYVASRRMLRLFSYKSKGCIYNFPPKQYKLNGKSNIREELRISSNDIVVVSVARITQDKGYHILCKAIKNFVNYPCLKFIIVGEGDYLLEMKDKLEKQVNNGQVAFLGYRDDVQRIVAESDFFVLPTLHETLSIALLEASMEGKALIASNTGGIPEIIQDGYNGLLVPSGDANALTKSIELLYKDKKLRDQLGRNAKILVKNKFSPKRIEQKISHLYEELLNRP